MKHRAGEPVRGSVRSIARPTGRTGSVGERSAVSAPVEGGLPGLVGDVRYWVGNPAVRRVLQVLDYHRVLCQQWPLVVRSPALKDPAGTSASQSSRAAARSIMQALRQIARRPDQTYLWVPKLREDADTPENRFVVFALRCLAAQASALTPALREQALRLRRDLRAPPADAGERATRLWNQGRFTASKAAQLLEEMVTHLAAAREWAETRMADPLLAESAVRGAPPRQPSLRLTRSPGYGPIYAAYRQVFGVDAVELRLDLVRRGLSERTVKPTSELYELWLFLETYAMLVERFGFRPVRDQPAVDLELQSGRLTLQRKVTYQLELVLENEPHGDPYRIWLSYEPSVDYAACGSGKRCYLPSLCEKLPCYQATCKHYSYGPDVVVVAEYQGTRSTFALDAKYRDYDSQPLFHNEAHRFQVGTNYEIDVLGVTPSRSTLTE